MVKNYYEILEISFNATPEIIKAAYRTLAKRYHADNGVGNDEKMAEINEAYEVLNNPDKKFKYDAELRKKSAETMKEMHSSGNGTSVELFGKKIIFADAELNALKVNYLFYKNSIKPIIEKFEKSMNAGVSEYMNTPFTSIGVTTPLKNMGDFTNVIRDIIAEGAIKTLSAFNIYSYPIDAIKYSSDLEEMADLYELLLDAAREDLKAIYQREVVDKFTAGYNAQQANDHTVKYEKTGSTGWDLLGMALADALSGDDGTAAKEAAESEVERDIREKKERFRKNFVGGVVQIITQVSFLIKGKIIVCIGEHGIDIDHNMEAYYLRDESVRNIFIANKDNIPTELLVEAFINSPFDEKVDKIILTEYTDQCSDVVKFLRENGATDVLDNISEIIVKKLKLILGSERNEAHALDIEVALKADEYIDNCCKQFSISEDELLQDKYISGIFVLINNSIQYDKIKKTAELTDDEIKELTEKYETIKKNKNFSFENDGVYVNAILKLLRKEKMERDFKDVDFDNVSKEKALELYDSINKQYGQITFTEINDLKEKIVMPILLNEINQLDGKDIDAKITFLADALNDDVYSRAFDSCISSLLDVSHSVKGVIDEQINNINQLSLTETESLYKQADEFFKSYDRLCAENFYKTKKGSTWKADCEKTRILGTNTTANIDEIEEFHRIEKTCSVASKGKLDIITNAIAEKKIMVCIDELTSGMENPFCANSIIELKKKIEASAYDQNTKSKVWTMSRDKFFESNMAIINDIVNKISVQYPVIRNVESGFVIYGDKNNEANYKKIDKEVSTLNTIEQPVISNVKGSLLGLAGHESGFSITQGTLLYYEKGIISRIFLKDITAFNVQKKLLATDLFVTTSNGMSVKLNAKIPKELLNNISFILMDIVNAVKSSELYSEDCI